MNPSLFLILTLTLAIKAESDQYDDSTSGSTASKDLYFIESIRRNWAFRSAGSDLAVTFTGRTGFKINRDKQTVKLQIRFYPSTNNSDTMIGKEVVEGVTHDPTTVTEVAAGDPIGFDFEESPIANQSENGPTTQAPRRRFFTVESVCRLNTAFNNETLRDYLCPIPSVAEFLPNFTANNPTVAKRFIEALPVNFSTWSCGESNSSCLCYGIMVDRVQAVFRRMQRRIDAAITNPRRPTDSTNRRNSFNINFYPDPIVNSAHLAHPHNLLSISGVGFTVPNIQPRSQPEYELYAEVMNKDISFQIYCKTTYENMAKDGFTCVFDTNQMAPYLFDPVVITVKYGNWSYSAKLDVDRSKLKGGPNDDQSRYPWGPPGPWRENGSRVPPWLRNNSSQPAPPHDPGFRPRPFPRNETDSTISWPGHQRPNKSGPPNINQPWQRPPPPDIAGSGVQIILRPDPLPTRESPESGKRRKPTNETVVAEPESRVPYIIKIVVPIIAVSLFILACVALLLCLKNTPLQRTQFFKTLFPPTAGEIKENPEMQPFSLSLLPAETVNSLEKHRIDKSRLVILSGGDLGEGFFGIVKSAMIYPARSPKKPLSATLSSPEGHAGASLSPENMPRKVAVKTIQRYENLERIREFFDEAIIMFTFSHPNVLSAIGFVSDMDGFPALVLPLMDGGNLHDFVKTREDFNEPMLYSFAMQIACGMAYLSSLNLVHRDLAARNCLLTKKLEVKVSDFGLTRQSKNIDYEYGTPQYEMLSKHRPLPIRWLAPECLEKGVFTEKSDVWSFGVLLWEMATRGQRPYGDMESSKVVSYVRLENGRLPRTPEIDSDLYDLMYSCWDERPSHRPTFEELKETIKEQLAEEIEGSYCDPHAVAQHVPINEHRISSVPAHLTLGKTSSLDNQLMGMAAQVTATSLEAGMNLGESSFYIDVINNSDQRSTDSSSSGYFENSS